MNRRLQLVIFVAVVVSVVAAILFMVFMPEPTVETVTETVYVPVRQPQEVRRAPEFREPPIKQYKPGNFQQVGLLVDGNNNTRPLYGKDSFAYRDRYHYYTTTPGEQIYPIPIEHDGRDCTEDIGCPEFFGNESVNVLGENYTTKIYRTIRNLL